MNPVVRIVSLIVFAVCIAKAELPGVVLGGVLLVVVSFFMRGNPWAGLVMLLRRIRWLLVSLIIIYGWLTPGEPMILMLGSFSPSVTGLLEGAIRIGALFAIVAAVHLLLQATGREQLLVSLHQLTKPLATVGFPSERLAARLVLVLETVPKVQKMVAEQFKHMPDTESLFQRMARTTREIFDSVLTEAEHQPAGTITLKPAVPIKVAQWLYPIVLVILFLLIR